jgi:transcriptional regulator with XRE-family HTH domain
MDDWRGRLREAIDSTGKKHAFIAEEAGIDPTTLSRILTGRIHPRFGTVVGIVHICGESVGWLLDEYGFTYSKEERAQLQRPLRSFSDTRMQNSLPHSTETCVVRSIIPA